MDERKRAEEHLRIIRSLMERATIYRAISAPTALVGGIASSAVGTALHFGHFQRQDAFGDDSASQLFLAAWGCVLAVTGAANLFFLAREARRRGGPLFSPGMRKALYALLPPVLAAAVFTALFGSSHSHFILPWIWMIFYGLGLLAT